MRRLIIGLVVLVAALVVLDRVSLHFAERDVGKRLQADAHTPTTPDVSIHGFPFLTQLVSGTFGSVDIDMHGLEAGSVHITRLSVQVHDAHVSMADVISQTSTRIHVKHATAQMFISYGDLARVLPEEIRSRAKIARAVVHAVSVVGADTISLSTPFGEFPLHLPGLPFGIRLTGAKATDAGLDVDGAAQGLVIPTR